MAISLTSSYTQDFNTLSNTAGSTANDLSVLGWSMTESGGGARDNERYAVDTGGSNTGDTYSYGGGGSTERALGMLQSGTLIPTIGAAFTNDSGSAIASLLVGYTGEQWRLGTTGRGDRIDFQYSLDATSLTTGTWVDVNALDFSTLQTTTTGAYDGNAAANRQLLSSTVGGLSIPAGATFWIRWTDFNASGADDGLAVDDFSISVTDSPPPPPPPPPLKPISQVQGSGAMSPLAGQVVTVDAIVVGDFQGAAGLGGFFLQEEDADTDADPDTSEGLFVFQGADTTAVALGDRVRVTGAVTEFGTAGATLTELSAVTSVVVVSSGNPLPAAAVVTMPRTAAGDLERFEGMRVTVPGRLTVTDIFDLQRFGEITLAADGPGNWPGTDARIDQYTQFSAPGVADYSDWLQQQSLRTLVLDDGSDDQNPPAHLGRGGQPLSATNTLRGGDTVDGLTGVMDQRFGSFRVHPTAPVDFDAVNLRSAAPDVGGILQVASFNLLNFFNGDGAGGGFPTSRGADSLAEFVRQRDKIVAAILGTGAEVVGLLELEDDGYGPASAIRDLVAALNTATAPGTWAFVDPGRPEMSTDEIAVGLIYQPAAVQPRGPAAVLDSAVDPRFDSVAQRPSLAQTFEVVATGALFTPVINHLKSKGTSAGGAGDADSGDGQGLSNGTRTRAAEALVDWLATDPTGQGDADFLILGDLNAYAQEDPLRAIRRGADDIAGTADDYTSLLDAASYSFSFDGAWGALDHALASRGLRVQVTGAAEWPINADEPGALDYNVEFKTAGQQALYYAPDAFRSSDHDPLVIGLDPGITVPGTPRGDVVVGTPGADRLIPGGGRDLVVGGGGADRFVFTSLLDLFDTIADFEPGRDRLDIVALMASIGAGAADPLAEGYLVEFPMPRLTVPTGAALPAIATLVLFDPDGSAGAAAPRPLVQLIGVSDIDPTLLLDSFGA